MSAAYKAAIGRQRTGMRSGEHEVFLAVNKLPFTLSITAPQHKDDVLALFVSEDFRRMDQDDPSVPRYFHFFHSIRKEEIPALPNFGPAEIQRAFDHRTDRKGIRIAEYEFPGNIDLTCGEDIPVSGAEIPDNCCS